MSNAYPQPIHNPELQLSQRKMLTQPHWYNFQKIPYLSQSKLTSATTFPVERQIAIVIKGTSLNRRSKSDDIFILYMIFYRKRQSSQSVTCLNNFSRIASSQPIAWKWPHIFNYVRTEIEQSSWTMDIFLMLYWKSTNQSWLIQPLLLTHIPLFWCQFPLLSDIVMVMLICRDTTSLFQRNDTKTWFCK